ncbi:MAG: hypothetical protein ACOY3Z_06310 [Thermodesulfobacteriota bacterium]
MAHKSFAGQVFAACQEVASSLPEFRAKDVYGAMFIQTRKEQRQVAPTLKDLAQSGKLTRLERGLYAIASAPVDDSQLQQKMWRILRARRQATVEDMVELTGAAVEYAREFFRMLEANGVVEKIRPSGGAHQPCVWRMINDPVKLPVDDTKAARLRELRLKKKNQALADIATAQGLLGRAAKAIEDLEVDNG